MWRRLVLRHIYRLSLALLFISASYEAKAFGFNQEKPVLYYADSQTYDRELGILILKGHVEFKHLTTTLQADYVTYNEQADLVTASGHVRIIEECGDTYFAEYMELTGDLKEGIALELRALLEDDSKLAALEGRKFEDRQELEQAVYTPCKTCGGKRPTWQLNAKKAIKNDISKNLHFTDTQLRILDTPVLYLPYASQPFVRKSGFMIPQPRFTSDSDIGFVAEVPYYLVLSEDKDMTLRPAYLTGQKNPFLSGDYRHAFWNGMFRLEGSITRYTNFSHNLSNQQGTSYSLPSCRGHVFAKGAMDLNSVWRTRGEGGYVSDKSYFRKYVFARWQSLPVLTSKAIIEGFLNQRDYAAGNVEYFQGLRGTDIQSRIAAPLPFFEYKAFSDIDSLGGRFDFDANFLNIFRPKDINMQRGIGQITWERPWVILSGQVFKVFGSLRGDLYGVENGNASLFTPQRKSGGGRFYPQAGLKWNWPFLSDFCAHQHVVVQPIVQIIGAPTTAIGLASQKVPDIDSFAFIFNDVNIFSPDRFPGYDLIETGSRLTYGAEAMTTGKYLGDMNFFLGQNYALSSNYNYISDLQGLRQGASDYVGRLEAVPWKWLMVIYRMRFAQQNFSPIVSEVQSSLGPPLANLTGTYVFLNKNTRILEKKNFNQLNITFSSKFTKYLTFKATLLQNLEPKRTGGGSLIRAAGLTYTDDCFTLGLTVQRQYFVAGDLRPQTLYLLTLGFKNVGDFPVLAFDVDKGLFGGKRNRSIE